AAMSAAAPAARSASDIVVTTVSDATNGDTSSVAALLANPGPDGVSLRESITATNNDPGTRTIRFAPSLKGATITFDSQLPPLLGGGGDDRGRHRRGRKTGRDPQQGGGFCGNAGYVLPCE